MKSTGGRDKDIKRKSRFIAQKARHSADYLASLGMTRLDCVASTDGALPSQACGLFCLTKVAIRFRSIDWQRSPFQEIVGGP